MFVRADELEFDEVSFPVPIWWTFECRLVAESGLENRLRSHFFILEPYWRPLWKSGERLMALIPIPPIFIPVNAPEIVPGRENKRDFFFRI